MYIVVKHIAGNRSLFLVDRNKDKTRWWSSGTENALVYTSKDAAEAKAASFKFGRVTAVDNELAIRFENLNRSKIKCEYNRFNPDNYEHPFSSDALGQWQ